VSTPGGTRKTPAAKTAGVTVPLLRNAGGLCRRFFASHACTKCRRLLSHA
jgi:hypothetical protein